MDITTSTSLYKQNSLDDASSTSSSFLHRITRKPDVQTTARRSISRSASQRSLEVVDISKFYVKMSPSKDINPQPASSRKTIIERKANNKEVKRTPTPVPSRKKKEDSMNAVNINTQIIENDLIISQLQKKYIAQKQKNQVYVKKIIVFQKQVKAKMIKNQELERKLEECNKQRQELQFSLKQFQAIAANNESSLAQTKSKLERLKNTIKLNRYSELELENMNLRRQNNELRFGIAKLQSIDKLNNEKIDRLGQELVMLQMRNNKLQRQQPLVQANLEILQLKELLKQSKSQKEETLEKLLVAKQSELEKFKLKVDKLEIAINFMNRKKNQEFQTLQEKKYQEINKFRTKLCSSYQRYNALQNEHEKLKQKTVLPARRSFLEINNDEYFALDLSP